MWGLLTPLLTALGGPIISGLVDGYKAKLAAVNTTDAQALELAKADLMAQIEAKKEAVSLAGNPIIARAQAAGVWISILYLAKLVLWDKVMGSIVGCSGHTAPGTCMSFTTDGVDGYALALLGLINSFAFGGQIITGVVTTVAKRFGK